MRLLILRSASFNTVKTKWEGCAGHTLVSGFATQFGCPGQCRICNASWIEDPCPGGGQRGSAMKSGEKAPTGSSVLVASSDARSP